MQHQAINLATLDPFKLLGNLPVACGCGVAWVCVLGECNKVALCRSSTLLVFEQSRELLFVV
jgi:hypothetical protein